VIQQEIKWALDVLDQIPEDAIYLIPARLGMCQIPDRLSSLHWVDLSEPDGFENLERALKREIGRRASHRPSLEPEMILIPGGEFLMGSDPNVDDDAKDNEQPQHRLYLPQFYLARTPVTNVQYAAFLEENDLDEPKHWIDGKPPTEWEDHPVIYVSWRDSMAYCHWLVQVTGKPYTLPSEAEWEKGARGTDGRIYPWGNHWDSQKCNPGKLDTGYYTSPVGTYPTGSSPYGLLDMAGNIWEWTRSIWGIAWNEPSFNYPYEPSDGRENIALSENASRVMRGGPSLDHDTSIRCATRFGGTPDFRGRRTGFRVALVPASASGHQSIQEKF
jgi:formylglycine-generating enzyme required for sulfatase activity